MTKIYRLYEVRVQGYDERGCLRDSTNTFLVPGVNKTDARTRWTAENSTPPHLGTDEILSIDEFKIPGFRIKLVPLEKRVESKE